MSCFISVLMMTSKAFENYKKEEAKQKYQSTGKPSKVDTSNNNRSLLYEEIEMLRDQVPRQRLGLRDRVQHARAIAGFGGGEDFLAFAHLSTVNRAGGDTLVQDRWVSARRQLGA